MPTQKPLTPKQERFVQEYLCDLNATAAAQRAGYKQPNKQGPRLLVNVGVQQAIQAGRAQRAHETEQIADYVRRNLKEVNERCQQHAPVYSLEDEQIKDTEGKPVGPFSPAAATEALRLLAKIEGLLPDRQEHTGKDGGPIKTDAQVVIYLPDNERDGNANPTAAGATE